MLSLHHMRSLRSIKTKFTGLSLLIVVPVLFFISIYYPERQSALFQEALLERYQDHAKVAAFGLAVGMGTENYELIGGGVEDVKKDKGLIYLYILDPQDEIMVSDNRTGIQLDLLVLKNLKRIELHSSIVRIRQPIIFEGKLLGQLLLGFSTVELDSRITEMKRFSYMLGFVCIVLISVLTWIMSSKVTRPLVEMVRATVSFSKGDLSLRIEDDSNDEVGELAHSFNNMIEKLKESRAALQEGKKFSESLLATVPLALLAVDKSFQVISVNKTFCRLFRTLPNLVEGHHVSKVLERQNFSPETIQSVLYGKEFSDLEVHVSGKSSPGMNGKVTFLKLGMTTIRHADSEDSTTMLLVIDDISPAKRAEGEKVALIHELQEALGKVKSLSGLLPICASCKKIRDKEGTWNVLEQYIHRHSEVEFSHGMCPECLQKWYPEDAPHG